MKYNKLVLVPLDLDYTIFMGNSVLFLNKALGISEKLEEYHADYRDQKISERDLNIRQAPILQRISLARAYEALSKGPIIKHLDRGVKLLNNEGIEVQMLSFNPLQVLFKEHFGIKSDISMLFEVEGDRLGEMKKDFPENKLELLQKYCDKKGIDLEQCAHVGDSRNDVATFQAVGFSIALNCSDALVERQATAHLKTYDFMDVTNTLLHANDLT